MELIGRSEELEELVRRCADSRLVTVVGPPGVGKTRLARAAAERAAADFPHGMHTVDLAAVTEPRLVAGELAAQLGFGTVDAMLSSPVDLPVLIVVDSCEHVLDAAADALGALLASCDAPTVLATSRSPLDLPGESVLALAPLAVRGAQDEEWSAAARLFRARARDTGVEIDDADRDAVEELCRALDGLPLAIEIAAARTRLLGPAELARTLDVADLARPRYRGAERHRSLHAMIEWSYRLLDDGARELFDNLGVISGEFLPEGAAAVSEPGAPVLGHVETLVAASMLTVERRGPVTWLRQLDTMRAFARARLVESGRWEATWDRFVDHVVDRVQDGPDGPVTPGRWHTSALSRLVERHARVLETLRWTLDHDEEPSRVVGLLTALWQTLHLGRTEESHALGERAIERWEKGSDAGWPDAAVTVAASRFLAGDPAGAVALAGSALTSGPSVLASVAAHLVLGQCAVLEGDHARAREHFLAGARAVPIGGERTLGVELRAFAAAALLGDDAAEGLVELELARREADPAADRLLVWIDTLVARALLKIDPARGERAATVTLESARAADFPPCEVINLHTMAAAALALGREAEATAWCADALERLALRGAVSETRPVLRLVAEVLDRRGDPRAGDLKAAVASMSGASIIDVPSGETDRPRGETVLGRREAINLARRALDAPASTGVVERQGTLRRAGDGWEASFAGRTVVLRSTKGLADLAVLLARPGREVHCTELAGVAVEQPGAGELIDATARRAYEQRIAELRDALDEADAAGDRERSAVTQAELDALVGHLSAAYGLRRARNPGGSTERARSTVTQRVRATVRRLASLHPELSRHLEVSLVTGTYCSYRPEHDVAWHVEA